MVVQWFQEPANGDATPESITPIPEPPGLPILGNIGDIDREVPVRSFIGLAEKYGEIFRLRLPGRHFVMVSSHRLVDELCSDEKRFKKVPKGALEQIRNGVHDGLFTGKLEEPNWQIAHRVFGPLSIRNMFDDMHDIATQLAMKFARHPTTPIPVSDDFTRLALDTLALCSMGYRFNSYYSAEMHPFISAMGDFLTESGRRGSRPLPSWFYSAEDQKYAQDIGVLRKTAEDVLEARKKQPNSRPDLLNAMLNGRDPKTGARLSDESIIDNLITFLIAGHETTSGTLSFTFYELLKNPEAYRKAQTEVDRVVGKGPIRVEHMSMFPYIQAVLRETLRLNSPITQFAVDPQEDTLLAGKYPVPKGETISMLLSKAHTDPAVWGEDANEYKPERMLDENFNKLPRNAWKPFGNGVRACIGRPFAIQEMTLIMAMLLQNFNFVADDPGYRLALKQTLTIKPEGFHMRAILRDDITPKQLEQRLAGTGDEQASSTNGVSKSASDTSQDGQPITILFGSNSGTCDALAQRLASDASNHGFRVERVDAMDAAKGQLPKNQPVVVITASYEGQPPDNAGHFVNWIEHLDSETSLEGVDYSVFGVGHHEWSQTFHRVPKLVDSKMEASGARRVAALGLADVGAGDTFSDFETWEDEVLWPSLEKQYGGAKGSARPLSSSGLTVSVTSPRTSTLRQDVLEAMVVEARTLTAPGEPIKKHVEIALPSGETYRAGDYLAILPVNPKETVQRVMRHFHLAWDAHVTITSDAKTSLPTNTSLPVQSILEHYVELAQPATKRNILALSEAAKDGTERSALQKLANEDFEHVSEKRASIMDLLETYPSVNLPLGAFFSMLPPMRVRQYSISSSPLWNPSHVTLTFAVLQAPAKSGQGTYVGVASSYLHSLAPGDKLRVGVRQSHAAFHLPQDPERTPVIMIAAGSGLAPFRGFVQERAELLGAGRRIAPAVLFFGCRHPDRDSLYAEELRRWEELGAVTVKRAYSRFTEGHHRYVQDALRAHRDLLLEYWQNDARLYICGSRAVGEGVREVACQMHIEQQRQRGCECSEEEAGKWWEDLRNARYATDVFD
ncbi:cytochrome P450 [Xylariomycetidae sp. FL0641]|nr:cytochrome P450 [Xylariomycetidae sp. FL0641]